jgi:hypothetical protein
MKRATLMTLAVLFAVTLSVAQETKKGKPKKVALKGTKLKKDFFLLGHGLEGELPAKGFKCRVGNNTLYFVDRDDDGTMDLFSMDTHRFFVKMPEVLLLPSGQYDLSFERKKKKIKAVFVQHDLEELQALFPGVAMYTYIRLQNGLPLIPLDMGMSRDCAKHCDYLMANGMADGTGGMASHKEDPNLPGYTEEGMKAGFASDIDFAIPKIENAMMNWYTSAFHRGAYLYYGATKFGAMLKHGVAMLYVLPGSHGKDIVSPPDGAVMVPTTFLRGELPNPVPGTNNAEGCGFPVTIYLGFEGHSGKKLVSATLTDASGRKVEGTVSCPKNPANKEWPGNSRMALFIPARPLKGNTWYEAAFEFEGDNDIMKWKFMTGK